jgi:hypothetical protein
MSSTLLLLHSYLRWLVLLAGLIAVAKAAGGYSGKAAYGPADARISRIFIGLLDLQFLLGLVLYFVSPLTRGAMKDMAAAMQESHVRFFVAEHPAMMVLALVVAHGANVWARKAPTDRGKFQRSALGFALALGLIIAGIPWFRMAGR